MRPLSEIRFRTSPFVELKPLSDLTPEQREPFLELEHDPDFHRLLIAKPPLSMNLKAVPRTLAKLLEALVTPFRLAEVVRDGDSDADIVDLVLDGILEVERGDGFVSGADALPFVCTPGGSDVVTGLSRDALLHAQDLETSDVRTLTTALYLFNRIPITPFWTTRFASADVILTHVGASTGALRALLEREWLASGNSSGWLAWSSRTSSGRSRDDVTYKLYISPRPERIRDVFAVVVRVLAGFPGTPFKIGDSARGLLRPDKFVAYFSTRAALVEATDVLLPELAGCEAHGVPFTAALDDTGLLSWGVDPPDNERALRWLGRESWRYWVVQRLAAAISIAKNARGDDAVEPWRFAIARARRHGVDVDTWTPSATLWSAS